MIGGSLAVGWDPSCHGLLDLQGAPILWDERGFVTGVYRIYPLEGNSDGKKWDEHLQIMDYPNFSQTHMAKIGGAFQSPHMETPPFLDHFCRETMVFSYLISMLIFNFPEVIEMTNIVGRFYQPPLDRRREAYWTLLRSEDNSPISRSQVSGMRPRSSEERTAVGGLGSPSSANYDLR